MRSDVAGLAVALGALALAPLVAPSFGLLAQVGIGALGAFVGLSMYARAGPTGRAQN